MQVQSIGIEAKNVDEVIAVLKQGLPADAFDRLRDRLHLTDYRLAKIVNIPKRTLNRRRQNGRLNAIESERLLRVARMYEQAMAVFEDSDEAERWLKSPARGLGGRTPLDYGDMEIGAQEVINLLGRIAHGVFPG